MKRSTNYYHVQHNIIMKCIVHHCTSRLLSKFWIHLTINSRNVVLIKLTPSRRLAAPARGPYIQAAYLWFKVPTSSGESILDDRFIA